jgi:hypothetical protein
MILFHLQMPAKVDYTIPLRLAMTMQELAKEKNGPQAVLFQRMPPRNLCAYSFA